MNPNGLFVGVYDYKTMTIGICLHDYMMTIRLYDYMAISPYDYMTI